MKTIKNIKEGFFSTSGSGMESIAQKLLNEDFKLRYNFKPRDINTDDYTIDKNGIVYFNEEITKNYWLILETNKSKIDIKIGSPIMLNITNSPNLQDFNFIEDKMKVVSIYDSFIKTGIDFRELSTKSKRISLDKAPISNFGDYSDVYNNISLPPILYGVGEPNRITMNNNYLGSSTNLKTISSNIKDINVFIPFYITNKSGDDDELKVVKSHNISLKDVLSNVSVNIYGAMTNGAKISANIDNIEYGFKKLTLILSPTFSISNLKKHLMAADLKGTEIKLLYTDKHGRSKDLPKAFYSMLAQVAEKRPELKHLFLNL